MMNRFRAISGVVVFSVLGSMLSAGQQTMGDKSSARRNVAAQRRNASLAPLQIAAPVSSVPDIVEPLPAPLAPLTPGDLPPEPPRVTYRGGVLTVDSQNSTLTDILREIHKLTGADFDPMPEVSERAVVHLTGSSSEVVLNLLRGSEFGFVIMSDPEDSAVLRKVFLTTASNSATAHSSLAREATPRLMPSSMLAEPDPAPNSTDASAPITKISTEAMTTPAVTGAVSAVQSAATDGLEAPTPQTVVMPDPVQIVERVNQQNHEQTSSPISAAGQYMQELYRLRLQQGNAASSSTSAQAAQQ